MTKREKQPNPLLTIELESLSAAEAVELDTALVREKLATYPVVAAATEYTISFTRTYSGFSELRENAQFDQSFDIFLAKLDELIRTTAIEHATTNAAIQEHTEGITAEKLAEFHEWLDTLELSNLEREQLLNIVTELLRLTGQYIAKEHATDATPPTEITEADFLAETEMVSELEAYYEEIELFLENIQYPIPVEELIEIYCEHHSVTQEELLETLQELDSQETGVDFDALYDLFGPILF